MASFKLEWDDVVPHVARPVGQVIVHNRSDVIEGFRITLTVRVETERLRAVYYMVTMVMEHLMHVKAT